VNKNTLLPVLVGAVALVCVVAVNANLSILKKNLDVERFSRLDAERKLESAVRNTHRIQDELADAQQKLAGIQGIVSQGQSTSKNLKAQAEAQAQENEDLKQLIKKLQEDLAASQKAAMDEQSIITAQPVEPTAPVTQ